MKLIPLIVRYGTLVLAIAGVFAMGRVLEQIRAQDKPVPPPPYAPPDKPHAKGVAATGMLEALNENVSIGTPVPGLVIEVPEHIQVGAQVKKDDALFRLDDRELRGQLLQQQAAILVAQANVDVAKAQLAKVQDMLDRLKSITDQRAISQDDLRNRSNDVLVAKAQLAASDAQLQSAAADVKQTELLIDRLTVRAPRAGSILQVNIRAGEYAAATNREPAMVLGDLSTLQVRADVDEQNAILVSGRQPAQAYLKGDSSKHFELAFVRIEPLVIPKQSLTGASTERVDTRVLQVIYKVLNPKKDTLYPGQQVDVFIGDAPEQVP